VNYAAKHGNREGERQAFWLTSDREEDTRVEEAKERFKKVSIYQINFTVFTYVT
jgi:hypothetical protein